MRLDLDAKRLPESSITSPRPPRFTRLTDKRNFESHANLGVDEGLDLFN